MNSETETRILCSISLKSWNLLKRGSNNVHKFQNRPVSPNRAIFFVREIMKNIFDVVKIVFKIVKYDVFVIRKKLLLSVLKNIKT